MPNPMPRASFNTDRVGPLSKAANEEFAAKVAEAVAAKAAEDEKVRAEFAAKAAEAKLQESSDEASAEQQGESA